MSDEPLPLPPDVLAYGEFTLRLRAALNRNWVVQIFDRDGVIVSIRGRGREFATRRAKRVCDKLGRITAHRRGTRRGLEA